MNIEEFTRHKLKESAKKAQAFWAGVRARLSKELLENEYEKYT